MSKWLIEKKVSPPLLSLTDLEDAIVQVSQSTRRKVNHPVNYSTIPYNSPVSTKPLQNHSIQSEKEGGGEKTHNE